MKVETKTKPKLLIKPRNQNAEPISVSIPVQLTKRIDDVAARNFCSRSAVIVAAVEAFIVDLELQTT